MKIAASILDCKDRITSVSNLNDANISYIHIDVMDGEFVPGKHFLDAREIKKIGEISKYPLDVHLMMANPVAYIAKLDNMNIQFITVHLEIDGDLRKIFAMIRSLGYKVGLSIKPNTSYKDIEEYLSDIDLVLVMSVEPGLGGQKFREESVDKIRELRHLIRKHEKDVLIEVDGGINDETIGMLKQADIAVVGSYIVKSDNYSLRVDKLLNKA